MGVFLFFIKPVCMVEPQIIRLLKKILGKEVYAEVHIRILLNLGGFREEVGQGHSTFFARPRQISAMEKEWEKITPHCMKWR